jgi:hypothetical protein
MRGQIDTAEQQGVTCIYCHGKGSTACPFTGKVDCRKCNGTGRITDLAELISASCKVQHEIVEYERSRPFLEAKMARGRAFLEAARAIVPSRFQIRRDKGWRKPAGGRYVNRSTRFGNPFQVDPRRGGWPGHVVVQYRQWITAPEQVELLAVARQELRGLDLGCNCALNDPCHADVLLELVNG